MKFLGLFLKNFQGYKGDTFIPFSPDKTIIKGRNDKGKTTIKKAMAIFGGVYLQSDYVSLINYDCEYAEVGLYCDNRTCMFALIYKFKVIYRLTNWQRDTLLCEWYGYSPEISKYINWLTVPGENMCINLMDAFTNPFINTSPSTNTQILNSLGDLPELELKIYNINEAIELADNVFKSTGSQAELLKMKIQKSYRDTVTLRELKTKIETLIEQVEDNDLIIDMIENISNYMLLKKRLNILVNLRSYEYLNNYCNDNQLLIENNNTLCTVIKTNTCIKIGNLIKEINSKLELRDTLVKIENLLGYKKYMFYNEDVSYMEEIIRNTTLKELEEENKIKVTNLLKNRIIVDKLEILDNIDAFKGLMAERNYLKCMSNKNIILNNINTSNVILSVINDIKKQRFMSFYLEKIYFCNVLMQILGDKKSAIENKNSVKDIVKKKLEFKICPLCKNELKEDDCHESCI